MAAHAAASIQPGDRPGILKLKKIKAPDGLSIIESIAAKDFKTFGMYLLNDDNGQKVKMIQKSNVTEELPGVVEAIINAWLDSATNPTYSHFVECLKDADMGSLWHHMKSLMAEGTSPQAPPTSQPAAAATAATSAIPNDELDPSELVFVLTAINDLNDWRKLGMFLGLCKQPTLDRIDKQNTSDIEGCKTDMLQAWFNWEDNVEKKAFGRPSWKRLVDAVRKVNKQVADSIVKSAPWNQD